MLHGWERITPREERMILEGIRDGKVYGGPFHAEFSPTDSCNYECFFCNSAFVDRSKRLPWPKLERTLNELIDMGVRSVRLAGGGEPLIYPEIDQFLDTCIERNVALSNLTTNAFKLTPKIIDRILRMDAIEIIVSFNDVDAGRYASTNGTTERAFDVVIQNLRNLVNERAARGLKKPTIIQQFFLWKGNHDQIEQAYDLGCDIGVDQVYVRDMYGIEHEKVMNADELAIAGEGMRRLIEKDKGRGKLLMSFSNEKVLEEQKVHAEQEREHRSGRRRSLWRSDAPTRTEYCYIGWYSTVIRGSGEVFPCCMLAVEPGYTAIDNVNDHDDFKSVWNGKGYTDLRTELRQIALGQGDYGAVSNPCHTRHYCAMRDACPFVASLANPEFYAGVEDALAPLRPRPELSLGRIVRAVASRNPFRSSAARR